jgi:hypothetical protein
LQLDDLSVNFLDKIDKEFVKHENEQMEQNQYPKIVSLKGNTSEDVLGEY